MILLFLILVISLSIDVEASFSGSGTVNDSNSMRNLIVFQQTYQTNGVTASSSNATVTYTYIGHFYYNVKENTYVPITTTVNLPNSAIYKMTNNTTGETWYSTSYISTAYRCFPITVTTDNPDSNPSMSFSGSLTLEGDMEYPPLYPSTTSLSYSTFVNPNDFVISSIDVSSQGVTLSSNEKYSTVDLVYYVTLSKIVTLDPGSYVFQFYSNGTGSGSGSFPSFLASGDTYVTNAHFSDPGTPNNSMPGVSMDAFQFSNRVLGNFAYFSIYSPNYRFQELVFRVTYFVTESVPAFSYHLNTTTTNTYTLLKSDSNLILEALNNQNNSLESAGGKNDALNNQNSLMDSTLSEYQNETDTSEQYAKISDDLFTFDLSIFTSVASTMTLFNACITSIFTQLGDLSVPLTMFLVFVFISAVIGIARVFGGGS